MAGSRELLDSLKPGMYLDKNFFLKVYGHEITSPGFAENVIKDWRSWDAVRPENTIPVS